MIVNEDKKEKMKVLFPDDIETITISKNDYDRLYGDLTYQNIELQQENAQINQRIEKALKFMHDKEIVFSFRNVRILREILEGTEEVGEDGEYI